MIAATRTHVKRPKTPLLVSEAKRFLPWRLKGQRELAALVAPEHGVGGDNSMRRRHSVGGKHPEKTSCLKTKPLHSPDSDQELSQGGLGVD